MERIKADDLYAYRFLSEVAVAPGRGSRSFWCPAGPEMMEKAITPASICWTPPTGAVRPLTGNGDEAAFRWLDSNTLIFPSCGTGDQPGKTAFTGWTSGEAKQNGLSPFPCR